ncbi:hypothetical protein [Nakamurella leprariae]|uniref:Uncharacterized protein n=1 Tax=Nakamurella leprariae TaxID=2803911 RepID=A0A938YFB2_9ACTN|nr:hypothetical protein [Nakamurella leprariae]MBM9468814.1 hypothetical protein [Nakamurella leprariae]
MLLVGLELFGARAVLAPPRSTTTSPGVLQFGWVAPAGPQEQEMSDLVRRLGRSARAGGRRPR